MKTDKEIIKEYIPIGKAFNEWQLRIEPDVINLMQLARKEERKIFEY